jgi:hypothetical protein
MRTIDSRMSGYTKGIALFANACLLLAGVSRVSAGIVDTTYSQSGGTLTKMNQNYTSGTTNKSAVYVTNSGVFNVSNTVISTTGNSTSTDSSSKYGLNGAVLTTAGGIVNLTTATITTSGSGANGLFATGTNSAVAMTDGTITCSGGNAHGVDVTYKGSITLTNVTITTTGGSSSAIATDFGGGTVTVTGGSATVSGSKSAGIYSTGNITVTGATVTAKADNGAVIDADGIINLSNTTLTGSKNGLMIHNTVGQSSLVGVVTMSGGSITGSGGDGFNVTGSKSTITIKEGTVISASTGSLVNAVSSSNVTFKADGETMNGDLVADATSTLSVVLQNRTTLKGTVQRAALSIDASSVWNVTGNSALTSLSDASGISGTSITNVTGNGYTVTYNASLSANSALGGKTYTLVNGGTLTPQGTTGIGDEGVSLPDHCALEQNYPNPFNPATTISYQMPAPGARQTASGLRVEGPADSFVKLVVCDVLGREVAVLVDGERQAGSHTVTFDGAGLASGMYFYSLRSGEFVSTKKMILAK